jgi:hypothetical protein
MNTEMIENVLHEILNEQKKSSELSKQLISKIEYLSSKMEKMEKETNNPQHIVSSADTKAFEIITKGIENIQQVVTAHPKNFMHKQIMIFPEFKSPECYKLLFNSIIYIAVATYSFLIIRVVVDHWCK